MQPNSRGFVIRLLGITAPLVLALAAQAQQSVASLVRVGDQVPLATGGSTVVVDVIRQVEVNDIGEWIAVITTPSPAPNWALIRNGKVISNSGDPIRTSVANTTVNQIVQASLSNTGSVAVCLDYSMVGGPRQVLYVIDRMTPYLAPTIQPWLEGLVTPAPTTVWPVGSVYESRFQPDLNDQAEVLVLAQVDIAGTSADDFAVVLLTMPSAGTLASDVRAKLGDSVLGSTGTILPGGPPQTRRANNASPAGVVFTGLIGTHSALVISDPTLTLVAEEATPSPISGTNWGDLLSGKDVSVNGDVLVAGVLNATNPEVIFRRTPTTPPTFAQIARTGDTIGGDTLTGVSLTSVGIDDQGVILWRGQYSTGASLYLDQVKLISTNTVVEGDTVDTISDPAGGPHFGISNSGRFGIFQGDTPERVFLIDRTPASVRFCAGDGTATPCPCGNNSAPGDGVGCLHSFAMGASLTTLGNPQITADTLLLVATNMPVGTTALFFQGTTQIAGGAGTTFGDGLRCAGGTVVRLKSPMAITGSSEKLPRLGDPLLSVAGNVLTPGVRTYQVWYRNAATFCTASTFNLTNGVQVTWL
jgi:hypothetical protein